LESTNHNQDSTLLQEEEEDENGEEERKKGLGIGNVVVLCWFGDTRQSTYIYVCNVCVFEPLLFLDFYNN
jgi:hypothetical protein